jgi:hypothetical protein
MAINISCKCGKQMKVKDELAGKAVRCPQCKSPLRIPGPVAATASAPGKSAPKRSSGGPDVDEKAALMKFQEAQKKKQLSAEEEAKYREEQNKLIQSYDQLSGRKAGGKDEKKKGEFAATKPKKATIFTKIADAFGAVFGTFAAKYIIIALLAGGGVIGSVYLVKFVTGYMHEETDTGKPNKERARELLKEARKDVAAKKWEVAKGKLDQMILLDRNLEKNRDYKQMLQEVEKALAKPPKK